MYTSFSVLCQPPPQKKCQNFQIPVIFRIFRQLLPLTLHGFHQTHAALIFIFYIDVYYEGKHFFLSTWKCSRSKIHKSSYISSKASMERNTPKNVITFSWSGKCIFIAEIKETGIQGEISSPIWYIFYLLPDKKKLDKKGAISIQ